MKDTILTICVLVGIFIILPFLILWIRDKLFSRPPTPEEAQANAERFQKRLASPDLDAVAKHFDCRLPHALRDLYNNPKELALSDVEVLPPDGGDPIYICFYNPADADSLQSPWPGCEKHFAFADDGCGNELLVDPTLDDPPVLWHDHETGEIETVAPSMSEFMKWKRQPTEE
jgi:hypothetical protein